MLQKIVIIDVGSHSTKVGYVGEDYPRVVIPTMVSYKKDVFRTDYKIRDGSHLEKTEFEKRALGYPNYKHRYPVNRGNIEDWYAVWGLLNYVMKNKLKINPKEYQVFIIGSLFNHRKNEQKFLDMIFNKFKFKAGYIGLLGSILSLHPLDSQPGLVIDAGSKIDIIPVIDQTVIVSAVQRLNIGGHDLSAYLRALLSRNKSHRILNLRDKWGFFGDMLKDYCYVALDYKEELNFARNNLETKKSFKLPESTDVLSLGVERFAVPEAIFQPALVGLKDDSLPKLIQRAIESFDHKIQSKLLQNIVLIGGIAQILGLKGRIMKELKNLLSQDFKIQITTPPNSSHSIWIGGSKFASKLTSNEWIPREEYLKRR